MGRAKSYYVECLERRREFLAEKVETRNASAASLSYVKSELAALDWALPILTAIVQVNRSKQVRMDGLEMRDNGNEKI